MRPWQKILHHLEGKDLPRYATEGCPVNCGEDWSIVRIQKANNMGPCVSASSLEVTQAYKKEAL